MKRSRWLWRAGAVCYSAGLIVFASPTLATVTAVSIGDVTFGWGHILVLIAAGAAWGDLRANSARDRDEHRRDREELRGEVRELRKEVRDRCDSCMKTAVLAPSKGR